MEPTWVSECGTVKLWCADCREVLPVIGDVDAVVTDPPYGVLVPGDFAPRVRDDRGGSHGLVRREYGEYRDTYENFCNEIVPALNTALTKTRRAAVFTGPHVHDQKRPDAIGGIYCPAATARNCWGYKRFLPVLLYGQYPNLNKGCSVPTAILGNDVVEPNGHPCPKPLRWMEWLVTLTSLEHETVCDPFMGSGTTIVAAVRLGRRAFGIEREPKYFAIAQRRIQAALNSQPLFKEETKEHQSSLWE